MSLYLDHNATTPTDPEVVAAMLAAPPGNPGSLHAPGLAARRAIEDARIEVARLVGARPSQVLFTSGGTESDNLALHGLMAGLAPEPGAATLLVGASEHAAVLAAADALAVRGHRVRRFRVSLDGRVDLEGLRGLFDEAAETGAPVGLLSMMLANNETGVIYPLAEVAALAREAGAIVHSDAVQVAGKLPLSFEDCSADLLALSAHKIYGPKGVGALVRRRDLPLAPLISGGGQEEGLRGGTPNVAGIIGFGVAARLARERLEADRLRVAGLRDAFESQLRERIDEVRFVGENTARLPGTSSVTFPELEGELLLQNLDLAGVCASYGAACGSGEMEPSAALIASGMPRADAARTLRFSFGRGNADDAPGRAVAALEQIHRRLRRAAS